MHKIAFIPARGGSKSIPLKNIVPLNGRPLIYWVAKAANDAPCIDRVIVATDDRRIRNAVLAFNLSKVSVYDRDPDNARDNSSTESVMLEYIEKCGLNYDDMFFLLQATSPLLTGIHISEMYGKMLTDGADSALSCVRSKRFYWTPEGKPINYDYQSRPRRQEFSGCLMENGACYINSVGNIKRDKNRLSGKISIYEMPEYTAIELDEPDDLILLENLMKKYALGQKKTNISLFLTDCDGVLTDGGMYYGSDGIELKKFNTRDGMAFELLRKADIKTGIITGEISECVKRRAEKIRADELLMDEKDKLEAIRKLCEKHNIHMKNVAYIGDDINDLDALKQVGVAACPNDAQPEIKTIPGIHVLACNGGSGCVREFARLILD